MSELIGIREAARRLGVSDTAVHKAIKAGRVTVAGRTEKSQRPLVAWPQAQTDWLANSDGSKRSHVGSTGSPRRAADPVPDVALPVSARPDEAPAQETTPTMGDAPIGRQAQGPSYAQSRAIREAYQARLAKLEYEQKSGKLIDADEVKITWFKHIKAAQTRIMGVPAACKTRVPDLPLVLVATIEAIVREAMEDLANGVG